MRRLVVSIAVAAGLIAGSSAVSAPYEPEGCQAFNPGQPSCSYKATIDSATPVSGASGTGSWVVTIKRGKKKLTFKPEDPNGGVVEFPIFEGDKVSAKALSPGTFMTVGSVQP